MTPLRLAFAGTPDFAATHLAALLETTHTLVAVLTQPDRPAGRGKQPRPSAVKILAQGQALPVLQPQTLRDESVQDQLRALDLDVLIVVAYGLILPQAVLDIPRFGCLNVHGSLLPRWRGAAPIQRAIEAGDTESGVTIMQMDAGLDTGPMLATASCLVPPLTTSGDLYATLSELGPKRLCNVLDDLPLFIANAQQQDDSLATYAHKIEKVEAALDWSLSATTLVQRICAFNPTPGCFSYLNGQRIKIWEAEALPDSAGEVAAGTITSVGDGGVGVACGTGTDTQKGTGTVLLKKLQFPGARAMSIADLLRGRGELLKVDERFGNSEESPNP